MDAVQSVLVDYLARARSVSDICQKFNVEAGEARQLLQTLKDSMDVHQGPQNLKGEVTWIAVPKTELTASANAWRWMGGESGQPYGAVTFPSTFTPAKIKIVPLDGILFGSADHDEDRFDSVLRIIKKEPNAFCFLNGDIISEVRNGSLAEQDKKLIELAASFTQKMAPIAHKILWAQQGCLERRSYAHQGFDPLEFFCAKAEIPYFKEPCYLDIYWLEQRFTLWAMHGKSTAQLKGAKINSLRRPAVIHDWTHFIISGHVGDAMWNRNIKICRDPVAMSLVPREEFHVILGNFSKFFGTRTARQGHQPASRETIALYLYPDGKHHVKTLRLGDVKC